jgi:nucleoid-associated protein YgaU
MIRTVIGFFVAAVAICAFIVFGTMNTNSTDTTDNIVEVTRAEVDPVSELLAPQVTPVVNTTSAVPEMANTASRVLAATQPQAPARGVSIDNSSIQDTTAGVLAALGLETAAPVAAQDEEMLNMTAGALASIRATTGREIASPAASSTALQELVASALREGQSDALIDQLVNEAAATGDVSVPRMLVTSDGRVDTSTLLASIVAEARIATGGAAPEIPDVPLGSSEGVEVRVVQRATGTEQYRFYTVNPGDSLGSIAVKFYGSVGYYPEIFEANRAKLSSPDRIQAGQRLVIPNLG